MIFTIVNFIFFICRDFTDVTLFITTMAGTRRPADPAEMRAFSGMITPAGSFAIGVVVHASVPTNPYRGIVQLTPSVLQAIKDFPGNGIGCYVS